MDPRRRYRLRKVIDRLLEMSFSFWVPKSDGRPGKLVEKLTPEEREILREARPEDFNHRGAGWTAAIADEWSGRKGRFNR